MAGSIHIKIDYDKAVLLKKDTLLVEKNLLEIVQHTRTYNKLRKEEFILKSLVKKRMLEIFELVKEIQPMLPTEELRRARLMDKKENHEILIKTTEKKAKKPLISEKKRNNIESEIEEIQAKLARLG